MVAQPPLSMGSSLGSDEDICEETVRAGYRPLTENALKDCLPLPSLRPAVI